MSINLAAIPDGNHGYLLDCDQCGPLGHIERALIWTTARNHLTTHGADMAEEPTCDCGYNYAHPTGHHRDQAHCLECTWTGAGIFADHLAYHHWLDQHHIWELTMGGKQ